MTLQNSYFKKFSWKNIQEKLFKDCEYCNSILKTSTSLIKHKETNKKCISLQNKKEKENIDKVFICEFCDKKFTAKQSKNSHLKTSYCKNAYEKELKIKEYEKQT